ncbi:cellulose-binding protein [Streptomyces sp. SL13]|uniref:Cellulose-binding protein n=1 Tax=Streptantibioticus silvisoli TaxID=2705255 RepID=A0AA90H4H6_9ACTN|nr:cellulose-binding protein [Streptantibioticus silvisoli]MDI5971101.1 cellulose-binding protein [Streptantibioticus silvisoli]
MGLMRSTHARRWLSVLGAICLFALLPPTASATPTAAATTAPPTAQAATTPAPTPADDTPADDTTTGNATHFDGLGTPYGGCGIPQADLDSQDFVALNVFNTPDDPDYNTRPVPAQDAAKMGSWQNGLNCGRWVRVNIGDYCDGTNDGAWNEPFCRDGGGWTADAYNGATLTMLVADSCADPNAWCRQDPGHLDLATGSLNRFTLNGSPVGDLYPDHWNNRQISWSFVPAPDYSGDISVAFMQNASADWPAVSVNHLPNGIHGVDYFDGGSWHSASMNSDMGQSYVLQPDSPGGTQYTIRVYDADGDLVQGGRTYTFDLPSDCGGGCANAYNPVSYTTG